jgi:hypothetical protein
VKRFQIEASVSRRGSQNPAWQINRHYRLPPGIEKVDFEVGYFICLRGTV